MTKANNDKSVIVYRTIIALIVVLIVGGFAFVYLSNKATTETVKSTDPRVAALADCLTAAGAKMYGTYWCPHCQAQKENFGEAFAKIDYVECADRNNPRVQTQSCTDAGITGYPTWVFADGSRLEGDQTFKDLAAKTNCPWSE